MKKYIAVEKQTDSGGYIEIVSELIQCKDCKYHFYERDIPYCANIDYGYGWRDEDYCSYAERKEE